MTGPALLRSGSGSGSASVTEIKASSGEWIQTISNATNPDYDFNGPFSIAFDGTHLWAVNYFGNSVTGFFLRMVHHS